jgi:hypothetical protein
MAEAFRERATFWVQGASRMTRYSWSGLMANPATPQAISVVEVPRTARVVPETAASSENATRERARMERIEAIYRP